MEIGDVLMEKNNIVKDESQHSSISPLVAGIYTVSLSTAVCDCPFLSCAESTGLPWSLYLGSGITHSPC